MGFPCAENFGCRHADGRYIWFERVVNPLLDEQGQVCGVIINSRDISDRKRDEEELRASEETLRAISDTALDASDHDGLGGPGRALELCRGADVRLHA